jgi:hypothetical protein
LGREDAVSCHLEYEFDVLMGVADYLNEHYDFRPSTHPPVFPGTDSKPLTNPRCIQGTYV